MPTGALSGGGIIVLLLALKFAKGVARFSIVLLALALIVGAAWWHLYHR